MPADLASNGAEIISLIEYLGWVQEGKFRLEEGTGNNRLLYIYIYYYIFIIFNNSILYMKNSKKFH